MCGMADFENEGRSLFKDKLEGKRDSGPGPASMTKDLDDSKKEENQQDDTFSHVEVMYHVSYGARESRDVLEENCCHPKWWFATWIGGK